MVYKSLNDQAPTYLTETFVNLSDSWKRELRNTKNDSTAPHRKSAFGQKCFHIRVRNCGMLFHLKSNQQQLIIHSKSASEIPSVNADSLPHAINSNTLS